MRENYRTYFVIQRGKITMEKYFVDSIQRRVRKTIMHKTEYLSKIFRVKNFHVYVLVQIVEITEIHFPQSEIYGTFCMLSYFFDKNFVEATFLLKKLLKSWFDEFLLTNSKFLFFTTSVHSLCFHTFFAQKFRESNGLLRKLLDS